MKALQEGLSPTLFVQPMHALKPPRRYRTIFVCGAFGLGSTREHDLEALVRFRDHLERNAARRQKQVDARRRRPPAARSLHTQADG